MNLTELAQKHGTDKWGEYHRYTPLYEKHFTLFKDQRVLLLEIGVGGYDHPNQGGNSLKMWADWFTHEESIFIGIDINEKHLKFDDKRIRVYQGNQIDGDFLEAIWKQYGDFDIIVDDGSHYPMHVIETFNILFKKLKEGGIYVIEDTQTSYWNGPWNQNVQHNVDNPTYSYFRNIPDWINYPEIPNGIPPNYFELYITGVHFYHNLIMIEKNLNLVPSIIVPSKIKPLST
jgi:hypothetical protein